MRIGIDTRTVTPPIGTYIGGYARLGNARGVRDPLRLDAVAWESDGDAFALVCLDLVFAHEDFVAALRADVERALGRACPVLVSCTHSHSTPYGTADAPTARFQRYADHVRGEAVAAVTTAWEARAEGTMRFHRVGPSGDTTGEGYEPEGSGVAVNRRYPGDDGKAVFGWNETGPRDPHARVVSFHDADGERTAVLVNYACHPICLPPWSRDISGDWVGVMRRAAEEALGVPVAFMQGAAADVSPRHEWRDKRGNPTNPKWPPAAETNAAACEVLGGQLAEDLVAALAEQGDAIEDGPIAARDTRVWLPLEPERDARGRAIPYWRGLIRKPRLPRWLVDALLRRAFPWTVALRDGDDGRTEIALAVQVARVGGLALASHGSEAFNATGAAVLASSPTPHTLFAGYANGMIGYVPPPEDLPRGGYEVDEAPYLYRLPGRFAPDAEPKARATTITALAGLFARS